MDGSADVVCQVCGTGQPGPVKVCSRCDTIHHADCWDYLGGCSTYGCGHSDEIAAVEPSQQESGLPFNPHTPIRYSPGSQVASLVGSQFRPILWRDEVALEIPAILLAQFPLPDKRRRALFITVAYWLLGSLALIAWVANFVPEGLAAVTALCVSVFGALLWSKPVFLPRGQAAWLIRGPYSTSFSLQVDEIQGGSISVGQRRYSYGVPPELTLVEHAGGSCTLALSFEAGRRIVPLMLAGVREKDLQSHIRRTAHLISKTLGMRLIDSLGHPYKI